MKKHRKPKPTQRKRKAQAVAPAGQPARRQVLKMLPLGLAGSVVLGGAGYWGVSAIRAGAAEYDLSRVGAGKPTIVQVHDPQCPTCRALQQETRAALDGFGECDLVYLVANVRTGAGHDFAQRHLVPHVTILMFDAAGDLRQTLRGMRSEAELRLAFEAHFSRYGVTA